MEPLHGVRLGKLKFKKVRDSSGEEEDAGKQPRPESPPPQWNPGTRAQPAAEWERVRQVFFERFDRFELGINARLDAMENDLKEHATQRLEPVRERLATIEGQWQAFSAQIARAGMLRFG
nr:hypothetical protein Iba_scaffold122639CG0010 [Ipomoea batatas]